MVDELNESDYLVEREIPKYTGWDPLNRTIDLLVTGRDTEHPVYGLGKKFLFHGDPLEYRKKDGVHVGVRVVFPNGNLELSYLFGLRPDGSVAIRNEGWCARADENEYSTPLVSD